MKKAIKCIFIIILATIICLCGLELQKISSEYKAEADLKNEISTYRPSEDGLAGDTYLSDNQSQSGADTSGAAAGQADTSPSDDDAPISIAPANPRRIVNQSIAIMQREVNSDIVGWLTIPNTQIDYPVVIAKDNDYYVHRDIYGDDSKAGSLFMDYRCASDFSGFNSIIYGHHMKNGSMFGTLKYFADPDFFESNKSGILFTPYDTYTLDFFAYMVVGQSDEVIYDPSADEAGFYAYVEDNARQYREPAAGANIITLSTCAYEFEGARMVLLATANT